MRPEIEPDVGLAKPGGVEVGLGEAALGLARHPLEAAAVLGEAAVVLGSELVPRLRGVSHLIASGIAVIAAVVMIILAPGGRATVAVAIYGTGLAALFGGSALYHRWPGPVRFKPLLQRIDRSTIFIFIAASYTPIALVVLHGPLSVIMLVLAWTGAAAGVAFAAGFVDAPVRIRTACYMALGWLALIAMPQMIGDLSVIPLVLICLCGVLYSVGAVIYARQRPNPWPKTFGFHEIFHALVIAAAASQYTAVIGWMLPAFHA